MRSSDVVVVCYFPGNQLGPSRVIGMVVRIYGRGAFFLFHRRSPVMTLDALASSGFALKEI